jgi:hypothetical protein
LELSHVVLLIYCVTARSRRVLLPKALLVVVN